MASLMFNIAKEKFTLAEIDWVDDTTIKVLLTTQFSPSVNAQFVADIVANELSTSGTNYVRKTLASKSVERDTTNNQAEMKAANVTWTAINAGATGGAIVFKQITNDADSWLVCWIDFTDVNTNGGDLTLNWSSEGVLKLT